jgi:hypothetical protein
MLVARILPILLILPTGGVNPVIDVIPFAVEAYRNDVFVAVVAGVK